MPIKVTLSEKEAWLEPTTAWKTMNLETVNTTLLIDKNFFVSSIKLEEY
jgi:hypothetical protein